MDEEPATHDATVAAIKGSTPTQPRAVWRAWVASFSLVAMFAATIVPTPLFGLYRATWDISPSMLGAVFATYSFVIIIALPLFGPLSDRFGRRPLLIVALCTAILSSLVFAAAQNVWWLAVGRGLHAVVLAFGSGAGTAALIEWLPEDRRGLLRSLTLVGMCAGGVVIPGLVSLLAQYAPYPLVLPYVLHIALTLIVLIGLMRVGRMPQPPQPAARGRVRLQGAVRWRFYFAAIAMFFCYCAMGPVLSIIPGYLSASLQLDSLILLGLIITACQVAVTLGAYVSRRMRATRAVPVGLLIMGTSLGVIGVGFGFGYLSAAALGVIGVGFGNGFAFIGTLEVASILAPPEARSATVSLMFLIGYLGFGVPLILLGWAAGRVGFGITFAILALALLAYGATIIRLGLLERPLSNAA